MTTINVPADRQPEQVGLTGGILNAHEALSLGAWLLAILAAELAIHGVGAPFWNVMPLFLAFTVAIAILTEQRYQRTALPHWLLASFAATLMSLNNFLASFTTLGVTLHDVHVASDIAAVGTAFFLLVESFTLGVRVSRAASLMSFLACCGFVLIIPALLFGLGPASLGLLLPLITSETTASVLKLPVWVPFVRLVPAVAGLYFGNTRLAQEAPGAERSDAPEGTRYHTA